VALVTAILKERELFKKVACVILLYILKDYYQVSASKFYAP